RTVVVKVRYGDFRSLTRSSTVAEATDSAHEIASVARRLFAELDPSPGIRLLGVGVSQLGAVATRQLSFDHLAPGGGPARARAEAAVDEVRARFGPRALGPASLIGPDGLRVARRGAQQWGPQALEDPAPDPPGDA